MNTRASQLTPREIILATIVLLVLAAQPLLPHLPQSQDYHHFADTRVLWGVSNALDTLSNAPFIIAGVTGIVLIWTGRLPAPTSARGAMSLLTFAGLIATGIGSAWYHMQVPPDDAGLAVDRYGMVIAFAGILGLAAADKVSERAGWAMGSLVLVAGPFSVWWWTKTGTIAPYAVLQFGGMALLVLILFWRTKSSATAPGVQPGSTLAPQPGPNWGMLIGAYAFAKVLEAADTQIWELTAHTVSGHPLKHLVAAFVAAAVIVPLYRRKTV